MDLKQHYNKLYHNALNKFNQNENEIDNQIEDPNDNRLGITLITKPPKEVKDKVQCFINELQNVDPHQYYYKNSDIHVTVISIISCYNGFNISSIDLSKYISLVEKSLQNTKSFSINFTGITASPSCIMLQGFNSDQQLNLIREKLRFNYYNSDIVHSIDERYTLQTAHSTIVRFRNKISNTTQFLEKLEKFREYQFGSFEISSLKLVKNDWYMRKARVQLLHEFNLT